MTKLVFFVLLIVVDIFYANTLFAGYSMRAKKKWLGMPVNVARHQYSAYWFLGILTLYVACIEARVLYIGGSVHDSLFWVHLCFAVSWYVLSALLASVLNGNKTVYHARIVYAANLTLAIATSVTGAKLIMLRF